jgi:hypothetical protein
MGIGRGASVGDVRPTSIAVGVGAAEHREISQVDGAVTFPRSQTFSFDVGAVYSQFWDRRRDGTLFVMGAFPYIRPRWTFGSVSIALAVSGVGFSGGEGGVLAGFADVQLGYGGRRWSVYGGAYGSACAVADVGPIVVAAQVRAGGEYWFISGPQRFGVALELYRQLESLDVDAQMGGELQADFVGGAAKLRIEW